MMFTELVFKTLIILYSVVVFPSPVGAATIVTEFLLSKYLEIKFSSLGKPNS